MITITPIKNEVRVHTGISRDLKAQIKQLAGATNLPQSVIINSVLAIGLDTAFKAPVKKKV